MLKHGPNEQTLARQSMQMGLPLPDFLVNAPELEQGLQLYLQAFFDLDNERSHALGPTPIPLLSIHQYATIYELDKEQTEDLIFLIKKMDSHHLKSIKTK